MDSSQFQCAAAAQAVYCACATATSHADVTVYQWRGVTQQQRRTSYKSNSNIFSVFPTVDYLLLSEKGRVQAFTSCITTPVVVKCCCNTDASPCLHVICSDISNRRFHSKKTKKYLRVLTSINVVSVARLWMQQSVTWVAALLRSGCGGWSPSWVSSYIWCKQIDAAHRCEKCFLLFWSPTLFPNFSIPLPTPQGSITSTTT